MTAFACLGCETRSQELVHPWIGVSELRQQDVRNREIEAQRRMQRHVEERLSGTRMRQEKLGDLGDARCDLRQAANPRCRVDQHRRLGEGLLRLKTIRRRLRV
jgi:predicted Fe-S protein YdhL (DUF1289 family)